MAKLKQTRTGKRKALPPQLTSGLGQAQQLIQAGQGAQARLLLERLVVQFPSSGDAHYLLGVIYGQGGEREKGVQVLRRALELDRRNPVFLLTLGNLLNSLRSFDEAREVFRKAIRLQPNFPQAHNGLGMTFSAQKRHQEALACYRKAMGQAPDFVDARGNYAAACIEIGENDEAVQILEPVCRQHPDYLSGWKNLGVAYVNCNRMDEGIDAFQQALRLAPQNLDLLQNLAVVALAHQRNELAKQTLDTLLSLDGENPDVRILLGDYCVQRNDLEEAVGHYQAAAGAGYEQTLALLKIGSAQSRLGRFDDATRSYRQALELDPGLSQALLAMVRINRRETPTEVIERLEAMIDSDGLSDELQLALYFALGKVCDDAGLYDRAFGHYARGNRLKGCRYESDLQEQKTQALMDAFTPALFETVADIASDSERPLFVLGMPRSGTTLTEQILASHPAVHGGGEQLYFGTLEGRLKEACGGERPYPAAIAEHLSVLFPAEIARYLAYLDSLDRDALRIVDKMPSNFLSLGLIGLLFPRAKIVHCMRNPIDTCLSIYFQNFKGEHLYAYDQQALGHYYRQYLRLMAHWRRVLPNPILDLRYEEMVADQEGTTRGLIEFAGLEWDDRCLAFQNTERAIQTASIWQARQPIYTTSVARWRHYEAHLQPLIQALGDVVEV